MPAIAWRRFPVPAVRVISLPSLTRVKATSGWAKLKRFITSTIWDSSACWLFIYFKRAGVLKKRSSTLILVPLGQLLGSKVSTSPPWAIKRVPCAPLLVAVSIVKRETEAMDGSASPRKPNVRIRKRSACFLILLVACRRKAKETSSCSIPSPLSMTWMLLSPASSISTIIWVAPASIEFSINSLTTLLGRSITSPAAIWLARFSGSSIIFDIVFSVIILATIIT